MASPLSTKRGVAAGLSVPEILDFLRLELGTGHWVIVDLGFETGVEVKAALQRAMRGCANSAFFHILSDKNPRAAKNTWFVAPTIAVPGVMSWDSEVAGPKLKILAKIFRFRLEEGDI